MSFATFHNLFDIHPASNITSPPPAHQTETRKAPQSLRNIGVLPEIELDSIHVSKRQDDTHGALIPATQAEVQSCQTPNELEMSRPPTPTRDEGFSLMRTWNGSPITQWRILCCCLIYFCNGINDSGMHNPEVPGSHSHLLLSRDCRAKTF